MNKAQLLDKFSLFAGGTGGIDSWLTESTRDDVFAVLTNINSVPITKAMFNQLLTLSHEAPVSDAFFTYYWLSTPPHPYDILTIAPFDEVWLTPPCISIKSLDQLYWGLYRFYVDALLFFGSIRTAYRTLRYKSHEELAEFFGKHVINSAPLTNRGPAMGLQAIAKDNRYLISEMASNSYARLGNSEGPSTLLERVLIDAFRAFTTLARGGAIQIGDLLRGDYVKTHHSDRVGQLEFAADDFLGEIVGSEADISSKCQVYAEKFNEAHRAALKNTTYYLSMVGELDVYVATSMRTRSDFAAMAELCDTVFSDDRLTAMNIRYFDPTLSAAQNHEDKGLIECLMVKCAKALVYQASDKDSYGKDAEAAMALSLGKPVIFLCHEEEKKRFLRDVHPLSRLIQIETGVAVGAMVTVSRSDVSELLYRIFRNKMEYKLEHVPDRPGYLHLVEKLTNSVVRLQTNDRLLQETFWNHYHGQSYHR